MQSSPRLHLGAAALATLAVAACVAAFHVPEAQSGESWYPLTIREREGQSAVYDPVRDRMIVFGGQAGSEYLDDVWSLEFSPTLTWKRITVAPGPVARARHRAVYDPVGDRMIVLGGTPDGVTELGDEWSLSLSGAPLWSVLPATPASLYAPLGSSAIYDAANHRIVAFGGDYDDVWVLTLGPSPTWSLLSVPEPRPVPRRWHTANYDPVNQRMLVFGGNEPFYNTPIYDDVWQLTLGASPAWSQIVAAGTDGPLARGGHQSVYDAQNSRLFIFGGRDQGGPLTDNQWHIDLAGNKQWQAHYVFDYCPPVYPRVFASSVLDPSRARWVLFGGTDGGGLRGDTWFLDFHVDPTFWVSDRAEPLGHSAAVFDPARGRTIVNGGLDPNNSSRKSWSLEATPLAQWGPLPDIRYPNGSQARLGGHTLVLDSARDRIVAYGGVFAGIFCGAYVDPQLSALGLASSSTWTWPAPVGPAPVERWNHAAIYDPVGDRMIVFGGNHEYYSEALLNDVWALRFNPLQWSQLAPAGTPPTPRYGHRATYDPVRHRMIVVGGEDAAGLSGEAWSLDLAGGTSWSLLPSPGTPLPARTDHIAVQDTRRDRVIVVGGATGSGLANDVWTLDLASNQWSTISPTGRPPVPRRAHTATYDHANDRVMIFGGKVTDAHRLDDVWALNLGAIAEVPTPSPAQLELSAAMPNPSSGRSSVLLALAAETTVQATVHDVLGRQVRDLGKTAFPAGRHRIEWDGRNLRGDPAPSGLYFYSVRIGDSRMVRKFVLSR